MSELEEFKGQVRKEKFSLENYMTMFHSWEESLTDSDEDWPVFCLMVRLAKLDDDWEYKQSQRVLYSQLLNELHAHFVEEVWWDFKLKDYDENPDDWTMKPRIWTSPRNDDIDSFEKPSPYDGATHGEIKIGSEIIAIIILNDDNVGLFLDEPDVCL